MSCRFFLDGLDDVYGFGKIKYDKIGSSTKYGSQPLSVANDIITRCTRGIDEGIVLNKGNSIQIGDKEREDFRRALQIVKYFKCYLENSRRTSDPQSPSSVSQLPGKDKEMRDFERQKIVRAAAAAAARAAAAEATSEAAAVEVSPTEPPKASSDSAEDKSSAKSSCGFGCLWSVLALALVVLAAGFFRFRKTS